jgi:hypothetical protein
MEDFDKSPNTMYITEDSKKFLVEIAKWSKFLSIIGMLFIVLLALAALSISLVGNYIPTQQFAIPSGLISFIYLVVALFYGFPVYYLYKAATDIKDGIEEENEILLTNGFKNLKSHYKFIGIFTLVIIAFYGLIIFLAILKGIF